MPRALCPTPVPARDAPPPVAIGARAGEGVRAPALRVEVGASGKHRELQRRGRDSNPRAACATNGFRARPVVAWIWLGRAKLASSGRSVGQCLGQSRAVIAA